MARIARLEEVVKERQRVHDPVQCGYSVFDGPDGERYLQLDTYGRAGRKFEGDASQSLQINRYAATQLIQLLERAFPDLK